MSLWKIQEMRVVKTEWEDHLSEVTSELHEDYNFHEVLFNPGEDGYRLGFPIEASAANIEELQKIIIDMAEAIKKPTLVVDGNQLKEVEE